MFFVSTLEIDSDGEYLVKTINNKINKDKKIEFNGDYYCYDQTTSDFNLVTFCFECFLKKKRFLNKYLVNNYV